MDGLCSYLLLLYLPFTTHTHTHTHTQMQILLLLLGGHARLAEPGCLCTKQGTVSRASKAPGAGLGTRRRTGLSSQQVVWAPEVPLGTIAVPWEKALNLHPSKCQVPNHSWVDWWGCRWKIIWKNCLSGLEPRTSGPEPRTQPLHHTTRARTHTTSHHYKTPQRYK